MPANDREVFDYLRSDLATSAEVDMITFAIFAEERHEWHKLFEKNKGHPPSQAEMDDWVSQITDLRFDQMRDQAARYFDQAARDYLADEMEAAKRAVLQDEIIREVKAAGGFWRQLSLALIAAILAPLIIGAVIVGAINFDKLYPTIGSVSERLAAPPADSPDRHSQPSKSN